VVAATRTGISGRGRTDRLVRDHFGTVLDRQVAPLREHKVEWVRRMPAERVLVEKASSEKKEDRRFANPARKAQIPPDDLNVLAQRPRDARALQEEDVDRYVRLVRSLMDAGHMALTNDVHLKRQ
jgi:hypothetical protein